MDETHTVYVLYSEKHEKIYVGRTRNLKARFRSHNELGTKGWTIKFRPWKIVYTETEKNIQKASKRERQLKSAARRRWIRRTILGQ